MPRFHKPLGLGFVPLKLGQPLKCALQGCLAHYFREITLHVRLGRAATMQIR